MTHVTTDSDVSGRVGYVSPAMRVTNALTQVFPLTRLAFDLGVEDVNVLGTVLQSPFNTVWLHVTCTGRRRLVEGGQLDRVPQRPRSLPPPPALNPTTSHRHSPAAAGARRACIAAHFCQRHQALEEEGQSQRVCQRVRGARARSDLSMLTPCAATQTQLVAPFCWRVMEAACAGRTSMLLIPVKIVTCCAGTS